MLAKFMMIIIHALTLYNNEKMSNKLLQSFPRRAKRPTCRLWKGKAQVRNPILRRCKVGIGVIRRPERRISPHFAAHYAGLVGSPEGLAASGAPPSGFFGSSPALPPGGAPPSGFFVGGWSGMMPWIAASVIPSIL